MGRRIFAESVQEDTDCLLIAKGKNFAMKLSNHLTQLLSLTDKLNYVASGVW